MKKHFLRGTVEQRRAQSAAVDQGKAAFAAGTAYHRGPYRPGDWQRKYWNKGWTIAALAAKPS